MEKTMNPYDLIRIMNAEDMEESGKRACEYELFTYDIDCPNDCLGDRCGDLT